MSSSDAIDRVLAERGHERPVGCPEVRERWTPHLRSAMLVEPASPITTIARATPCAVPADGPMSEIWAGADVRAPSGASIAMVSGMFQVPSQARLSTPGRDQHVSFWVGIDNQPSGSSAPALLQAGVQCDVTADGQVTIYPWWEWFPGPLVRILAPPAKPGQLIRVDLMITSTTTAELSFINLHEVQSRTFRLASPPGIDFIGTRALWIAERPTIGGVPAELANFDPVRFDDCVAMSHTGVNGVTDKHTLDETSPISPALASIGGFLFLAWRGEDSALNLIASDSGGQTFGSKLTLPQTTSQPPALCAHRGRLFLAWVAERTDQLHVAEVVFRGTTIDRLTGITPLRETSPVGPALASLDGRLFLAWKGDGNDFLNVAVSTDNAPGFTAKHTFTETSPHAPALCALDGDLFLGWSSPGTDQLQVARVMLSGDRITGLATTMAVPESSPVGPALAAVDGRLALAWKGDGNNFLSVAYADPISLRFHDKLIAREHSPVAPALTAVGRQLVIGWKGDGDDFLNVAFVQSPGPTLTTLPLTAGETYSMSAPRLLAYACIENDRTVTCSFGGPRLDPYHGLTETTPDSPAIAALDSRLFLGWKGDGNDSLNLAYSDDAGDTFGHKLITDVGSPYPPALGALITDLFIAWTGELDNEIRVGRVAISGATITGIVDQIRLGETTQGAPTLAALGGRLFVAFRGDGDDRLYIVYSDDRGKTFGHRFASTETTHSPPVLFAHGQTMQIAWQGTDNRLNLAQIDVAPVPGASIAGLSGKITLDERSPGSVAATVADSATYLAWKGLGNDHLNFTTDAMARRLDEKYTALEQSRSAPALCNDGRSVYVAWRDAGDQITVARLEFGQPT